MSHSSTSGRGGKARLGQRRARLRQFGITPEQYDYLLDVQRGRCAICERVPGKVRLAVDHCHTTGFVRGLLCSSCNRAIAVFRDNAGNMERAAGYLRGVEREWDSLSLIEQEGWLPYRGRVTGKLRRKRISKLNGLPRLP